jgi:hypothetical protein
MTEGMKYCPDCAKEVDVGDFYLNRGKPEKYCKTHKMMRQKFDNSQKYAAPRNKIIPIPPRHTNSRI